jgi:hypothetical protein
MPTLHNRELPSVLDRAKVATGGEKSLLLTPE